MADEYQCDECKQMTDTIYFYRPLCEKCYRIQKEKDKNDEVKEGFIPDSENLGKEEMHTNLKAQTS
jgi:NifB/MoaA-like Fe-S oxidoreductase